MWPPTAVPLPELPVESSTRTRPRSDAAADGTGDNPPAPSITELLHAWGAGEHTALDALIPIVYDELRRQARRALRRESVGHTLQPTALVHEAFLRLIDQRRAQWESRTQFFAVAAQVMRRVLVDSARTRRSAKRGGGVHRVTLSEASGAANRAEADTVDLIALDEALARLTALDPAKVRLVELRYFAGLSVAETAEALGVSPSSVDREWAVARRWLRRELEP